MLYFRIRDLVKISNEYQEYIYNKICSFKLNLAEIRRQESLLQKDIVKITGLRQQTISRIEQDNNISPTLGTLIKYIDSLGYELMLNKKSTVMRILDNFVGEIKF